METRTNCWVAGNKVGCSPGVPTVVAAASALMAWLGASGQEAPCVDSLVGKRKAKCPRESFVQCSTADSGLTVLFLEPREGAACLGDGQQFHPESPGCRVTSSWPCAPAALHTAAADRGLGAAGCGERGVWAICSLSLQNTTPGGRPGPGADLLEE